MDGYDFSKAYDSLRSKRKLDYFFPPETVYSLPVALRRGDRLFDGVFAYIHDDASPSALRPFGWALFSAETGDVGFVADCAAADFINPEEFPHTVSVSMALPRELDPRKLKAMRKDLVTAYEALRHFAFEENLNRDQVATIIKYKDLFMQLCHKGLYPFYHALSPAFFHWLRLPIPERGLTVPKEEHEEDTKVYQHQLMILENLQQLVKQFQDKIAVDSHKEKLFDELHKEVTEYKNGMLESLSRHIELDVIQLIDSVARTSAAFRAEPCTEESYKRLFSMLEGVETDLRDILFRQGVDPFTVPGDDVDTIRQTTVATVPTDNEALNKKVAARISPGWIKDGRVIRPERVSVYICG